jgi:hypothetical protein
MPRPNEIFTSSNIVDKTTNVKVKFEMTESLKHAETLEKVDVWSFADEWGPEKVIQVYDVATRMRGF